MHRNGLSWYTPYLYLLILIALSTPLAAVSEQKTGANPPMTLAGILSLENTDIDALVYDADTRTGAILHDASFTLNDTLYTISRIEVAPDRFSLQIQQDGQETDEATILADRYIVFKKEFSAIGYIDANRFAPHTARPDMASIPLTAANGLQKDDFLSDRIFEITTVKPIVNRYPEELQPLPDITRHLADGPITLRLTEYYKDPEGTQLSFRSSLDGPCCVAHHGIQENILTITPIGVGTTTIEVEVYDTPGYLETGSMEIEILPDDSPTTKDTNPPIITNEKTIEVSSAITPAVTVSVDHQAYAGENLQVIFDGSDTCKQLSSDTIEGTSIDTRLTKVIYSGILTGSTQTTPVAYGYRESEHIGDLTPTTIETDGVVYRITELLYDTNQITLRIEEDAMESETAETETAETETAKKYPDVSDHYLILKNNDETLIGYAAIGTSAENGGTFSIPLESTSPLRNQVWFDGTTHTAIELTANKPGGIRMIPPQTYTATIIGPSEIYSGCTLTVKDSAGHRAEKPVLLSTFTILRSEEEKEAELRRQHPNAYAPFVPEQQTPKKQYSLLIAHEEKEDAKKLLQIGKLALGLVSPDISVSSVQTVDLGRRSNIPEVHDLQVFLNLTSYTVAQTGWGSRGMETEYFGPATERAIKAFQKGNGIQATGDLDQETKTTIRNFVSTKIKEFLSD